MCAQRLQAKILKLVDISYGGENGFNQAIELSAEVLSNVKFIQEKKLIGVCLWHMLRLDFGLSQRMFACACVCPVCLFGLVKIVNDDDDE